MELWYHKPAHAWVEALPLGNGRIGAMVYGGIKNEKLSLNEDTLWSGYPRDLHRQDVYPAYVEARDCALRGDVLHAQEVLETRMLGPYGQAYMPLGDLLLTMDHEEEAEDYRRTLDLGKAVSTVDYTIQDVCYHRQCFISAPAQTLVLQLTADQDASISCHITLQCALKSQITAQGTSIILEGICPSHAQPNYLQDPHPLCYDETPEKRGIRFYAQAEVLHTGGTLHVEDGVLTIQHADAVTLLFCVRSNFAGYDKAPEMAGKAYIAPCIADIAHAKEALDTLLSSHISDYQQYFSRVSLHLDGNRNPNLPTDERLLANAQSHDDVGLIEQLFQYGRYLMISASRPGTQPMNLQGIWNDSVIPPWSSNYTVNINTEMNYWPAFLCNLGEMNEPLVSLIRDISVAGRKTAQTYYHARGFVSHHNIDLWRMTTPVGDGRKGAAVYGFWPMSSGWLCEHLFAQYAFTGDEAFLRDTAYPLMKEAALFYLDVLVEDDAGHLIFAPSTSPENCYLLDGIPCAISRTTTMTTAILRELFTNCISACNVLHTDVDFAKLLRQTLAKLPPFQIGSDGRLLEWAEEMPESEVTHRHISHLYGLHPAQLITPQETPALAEACKKSHLLRTDDGTGWSLGWKINHWARLLDGNHAFQLIERQLRPVFTSDILYQSTQGGGTYPNLLDAHPPFQIDGNFGACAGIAEMLLQSRKGELFLLPALPDAWQSGYVSGLRARDGLTVELAWTQGQITQAYVTADYATTCRVDRKTFSLEAGVKTRIR